MRISGKHAQMKMGETIAIMFIFFLLLIAGAVFYMNLQRSSISQDISQAYELRAVEIAQTISFLPEVQCTESNVVKASCFDIYKMIGMSVVSQTTKGNTLYLREFGTTTIKLTKLYPGGGNWVLYDNPKESFSSAPITNVPIMLYNSTSDKYYFGVLQITTYS
ncbi:MAG: hypothetical protein V1729_04150 [Candidatus Woesearchaeota archaeon]